MKNQLSLLLLLLITDITVSQRLISVSKVSVRRGESVTIPFLYDQTYKHHKKYCFRGSIFDYRGWYAEVHNGLKKNSQNMSMSDDVTNSIFTLTVRMNVGESVPKKYHCSIDKGGRDNDKELALFDTAGTPELHVHNQTVFGNECEAVVVDCYHGHVSGERKWCRIGGSCLSAGQMDGMSVETAEEAGVFRVTLRNLQEKNSGWYWCSVGEFQMPVHITVSKRTCRPITTPITQTTPASETPSTSAFTHPGASIQAQVCWEPIVGILPKTALALVCTLLIITAVKLLRLAAAAQAKEDRKAHDAQA